MRSLIIHVSLLSASSLLISILISLLITDQFDAVIVAFNIGLCLCAGITIGTCMVPDPTDFR